MFHVPERYRVLTGRMGSDARYQNNGAFRLHSSVPGRELIIIASDGEGWEHVSVHAERGESQQTPYWEEMCFIKDLFWDEEDVVMQLHPKKSEYVNNHANTLHLWRPTGATIPTPPAILVGIKGMGVINE
jgi:hypothetical protein